MQERRTTGSVNGRNIPKNNAVEVKKSNNVQKNGSKLASAKRAGSLHAVRSPKVVTIKKENKAPFPWAAVLVTIIFTCLFLFMMMNYAEVDRYRSEIADLRDQQATMQKYCDELNVQYGNKYDPGEIAEYAKEHLGMVPGETIGSTVITVEQPDRTELHTYDDGEEGGFGFLLTGFGELINNFID